MLKYGPHFPLIHRVEPVHEFLNGCTALQVLEEGVHREPGSSEHPVAADLARYALNRWQVLQSITGSSPPRESVASLCGERRRPAH